MSRPEDNIPNGYGALQEWPPPVASTRRRHRPIRPFPHAGSSVTPLMDPRYAIPGVALCVAGFAMMALSWRVQTARRPSATGLATIAERVILVIAAIALVGGFFLILTAIGVAHPGPRLGGQFADVPVPGTAHPP